MMSRLCLLAITVTVLCLPLPRGCHAGLNQCADEIDAMNIAPQEGINNYVAYGFTAPTVGDCENLQVLCNATVIPTDRLFGRTWFITNIKPNFGFNYDNNIIQDFRVQCPERTILHLYVQRSALPRPGLGGACTDVDFVRVGAVGIPTGEVVFCGDDEFFRTNPTSSFLYNNGRGRLFPDGKASISFCSNSMAEQGAVNHTGFVIRATCLNPRDYYEPSPGCVDLSIEQDAPKDAHDLNYVDRVLQEYQPIRTIELPHKKRRSAPEERSGAWVMKQMAREKRFVGSLQSLDLMPGDNVTYTDFEVIIIKNGTGEVITLPTLITCFIAFTPLIGTRFFFDNAPFTFSGPGRLDFTSSYAQLIYTITPDMYDAIFLPGFREIEIANRIYDHIFENWIRPYPIISTEARNGATDIFPLPPGNNPPVFPDLDIEPYRPVQTLGFLQEDIQSGNCLRAIRIATAPSVLARLPTEIINFCQTFFRGCDLTLRTACLEAFQLT